MLEQLLRDVERIPEISERDIDAVSQFILDSMPAVEKIVEPILPAKAKTVLARKSTIHWPDGSGVYQDGNEKLYRLQQRREAMIREREFGAEIALLSTGNDRKRARIWNESKDAIERQYGRTFSSPEEIAFMNGIFESRDELLGAITEMSAARQYRDLFASIEESGWSIIVPMWKEGHVALTMKAAGELHGLLLDVKDPEFLISDVHYESKGWNGKYKEVRTRRSSLIHTNSHHGKMMTGVIGTRNAYTTDMLLRCTAVAVQADQDILPFGKAMSVMNFEAAHQSGIRHWISLNRFAHERPAVVNEAIMQRMKRIYAAREDPELQKWISWYTGKILDRWKATAVDHDRLFSFYVPDKPDRIFMAQFHMVRDGAMPEHDSDEFAVGRLPKLLKTIIADGILKPEDVNPPLRERYALPGEGEKSFAAQLGAGTPLRELMGVIEPQRTMRLLTAGEAVQLPYDDFRALAGILDPAATYVSLGKGNNIGIFARLEHYPSGDPYFAEIYRIAEASAHDPNATPIIFKGKPMQVKLLRSYKKKDQMRKMASDVNTNIVFSDNYTVIADIGAEEFSRKHLADFVAVALAYRSNFDADMVRDIYSNLESEVASLGRDWDMSLGETDKVHISSLDMGGKFAFQVKSRWSYADEAFFITTALTEYLHDAGIPFSPRVEMDERAREGARKKLEARAFEVEHLDDIIKDLQSGGLGRVLTYVANSPEYRTTNLGASFRPCEDCGQEYINGEIKKRGWDQWDGVWGHDLHALVHHPTTYGGNRLNLIHEVVEESKGTAAPALLPAAMAQDIRTFAAAYERYLEEQPDAYEAMGEGLIESLDPEEVAGNPDLEHSVSWLQQQNRVRDTLFSRVTDAARKLQEQHPLPLESDNVHYLVHAWSQAVIMQSFWQAGQKRITDGTDSAVLPPMKIYINKY